MGDLRYKILGVLECTFELVNELLEHYGDLLSADLKNKLETFRADLGVAIEDHEIREPMPTDAEV